MSITRNFKENKMSNKTLFAPDNGVKKTNTTNEAGGIAYLLEDKSCLAQLAVTGCLNRTFYTEAETQLAKVLELTKSMDSEFIAKTAIFAREKGHMKDMPALLISILAARRYEGLSKVFHRVIDNGKMLRNFVQIIRSGTTGRRSFGTAPKRLVREWFGKRTEDEIFRQSIGSSPSIMDILKLIHPKPETKGKEALYGWLLGKKHDVDLLPKSVKELEAFKQKETSEIPNVPFEMLTSMPLTSDNWCEIARNARWQWLRMNINTLQRHGVFAREDMVTLVANKLADEDAIRKARAFPYQLLSAYINIGIEIPMKIRNALQDALEIATANVPVIDGKVKIFVDVSGSMAHPATGIRAGSTSKVTCVEVAALIASVILRKNNEAEIIPFSDRVKSINLNPRDSVMTNAQKIRELLGGGTNCASPMILLNERKEKADFCFLISDNQSWIGTYNQVPNYRTVSGLEQKPAPTRLMVEWQNFKKSNPNSKMAILDIQPSTTTQAYERDDILNCAGFSDSIFDLVSMFANDELKRNHWVGEIEKIEL